MIIMNYFFSPVLSLFFISLFLHFIFIQGESTSERFFRSGQIYDNQSTNFFRRGHDEDDQLETDRDKEGEAEEDEIIIEDRYAYFSLPSIPSTHYLQIL